MSLEKYLAKKSGKGFKSSAAKDNKKSDAATIAGKESTAATKGGESKAALEDAFKKSKERPYMTGC